MPFFVYSVVCFLRLSQHLWNLWIIAFILLLLADGPESCHVSGSIPLVPAFSKAVFLLGFNRDLWSMSPLMQVSQSCVRFSNPDCSRIRRVWRILSICSGPASASANTFMPIKLPIPMLINDQIKGSIPSGRAWLLTRAGIYRWAYW